LFRFLECTKVTYMKISGFNVVVELIEREKRNGVQGWKALEKTMSAWKEEVQAAKWQKPTDVQNKYGSADQIGDSRIVFNICGNKYRLVVKFNYPFQVARVRFAGTHKEYDNINATTV